MRIWTTVETRVWDGSGGGGGGGEREERERLRIGKTIGWWDDRFVFPATVIQLVIELMGLSSLQLSTHHIPHLSSYLFCLDKRQLSTLAGHLINEHCEHNKIILFTFELHWQSAKVSCCTRKKDSNLFHQLYGGRKYTFWNCTSNRYFFLQTFKLHFCTSNSYFFFQLSYCTLDLSNSYFFLFIYK